MEAPPAVGRFEKIEPSESCLAWRGAAGDALIRVIVGRRRLPEVLSIDDDDERTTKGEGWEADAAAAAEASSRRAGREDGRPMAFIRMASTL